MFKNIHIENFRSCASVDIQNIDKIIALLGKNGAGKTNVLQGISWGAHSAIETEPTRLIEFSGTNFPRKAIFEILIEIYGYKYEIDISLTMKTSIEQEKTVNRLEIQFIENISRRSAESEAWTLLVARNNELAKIPESEQPVKIGRYAPCMPTLAALLTEEHPTNQALKPLRRFLAGVRYYPLDETLIPQADIDRQPFIRQEEYVQWLSRLKTTGYSSNEAVVIRILHMRLERPKQFEELCLLLGKKAGLGLIDDIHFDQHELPSRIEKQGKAVSTKEKVYRLTFKPCDSDDRTYDYSDLSVGTRRILRIFVSMLFDGSSAMLMEQPEDAIHLGLMKKVSSTLKTNADPLQFFLATHSAEVFNTISPSEVRLVSMSAGKTTVRALTPDEISRAEKFMQRDGSLSEYLELCQGG
jgi:AAA domain, putative AbiEii toxin, Type IV TA system/AAA ATPase domain